ncbi:MAG: glycosyltransferase [Flavobacterium sp.]|nr:MAG: glycosyltransferase [Flavobacterium sp.]
MKASIIMSTYNAEEWLEKVLWGFSVQTERDFEIIIADDGSSPGTKDLIERLRSNIGVPILHVWHEDHGFQKTQILNKAIVRSTSDYLIFTDGDCIPRRDFVASHLNLRQRGRFLSGGYFKLPLEISKNISKTDIIDQRCFDLKWLRGNGLKKSFKNSKFIVSGFWASLLNSITTTKPSWNGHNASGWKQDIVAVNGFNQDMQYGGEDREFGERLVNFGIRPKQIRYSAICIHLEHERSYANEESKLKNMLIRKYNKKNRVTVVSNGINRIYDQPVELSGQKRVAV